MRTKDYVALTTKLRDFFGGEEMVLKLVLS